MSELEILLQRKWKIEDWFSKDGTSIFKIYPEDDPEDGPLGYLQVFFDIQERKEPRPYQDGTAWEIFHDAVFAIAEFSWKGTTWELTETQVEKLVDDWSRQ